MDKPLIGITTAVHIRKETGSRYVSSYAPISAAVELAGGLPIMIPCEVAPDTLRAIYERVDGVLIPGGGDVDPSFYNAEPHPTTSYIEIARDRAELSVARWAAEDRLPLFAICRGHQVVNVALGGSLIQDIASLAPSELKHDNEPTDTPRSMIAHGVEIVPESRLATILGDTHVEVNSLHHQAVERLAPGLRVTAKSTDGIIEATEMAGDDFFLTVQWHPEDLLHIEQMTRLFAAFVEAAAVRRQSAHRLVG